MVEDVIQGTGAEADGSKMDPQSNSPILESLCGEQPPFKDAEPTVRKLKSVGYKLGIVSDSDGTPGMKRKRIRQVPFHNLFDAIVVAGEDTPRVKPGHESFSLIARKLRVQPKSSIY